MTPSPNRYLEYLARADVLAALGVPVNYTDGSVAVVAAFNGTGDYARGGYLPALAALLDAGVHVALLYGDRDFACNWVGGERVSLVVAHAAAPAFRAAGYADVELAGGPSPGQVRQHGLFAFVRVYQAGHMVPSSQPRAAYHLFRRAVRRRDLATGRLALTPGYATCGPFRSTATLRLAPAPAVTCHVRALPSTCAANQIDAVARGTALVRRGVVVHPPPPPGTCPAALRYEDPQ